ncbi:MAG: insulinase family protein [Synechococcales cyanobacterium K44_A2020_017]|nr:insulinase family protein [Synechococcales cyanobacterium K32_A2020_035]MBF2096184.1 insulinase family protein [Synechococcales cyanobacterium K44_A2020_017]
MQRLKRWQWIKTAPQQWHASLQRKLIRYGVVMGLTMVVLVLGFGRSPALADTPRHYTELEFAPLPEIQVPNYTRVELDNGIKVFLIEDHELPLVSGTAIFGTGDRLEPGDQVGLAGLTGEVMRSGGTLNHPADELNQILEQDAASIETGIGGASGSASFDTLTKDAGEVLQLFAEVIRQPAFPQEKIDLAKSQREGGIARRNDDPDSILGREFSKLIYGEDSPYARTMEYSTLDNIAREDMVAFYDRYIQPNNMMLGIVGDFETREMRSLIEETFGDWQATQPVPTPELPPVEQVQTGGLFVVDQPQLTQSNIRIGHLGGLLNDPNYASLSVMNEVMNGLGGRLVNEVRSRQGLAYVVYAFWSARYDYPGIFVAGGQTRSEATVPFIESVKAEIETLRTSSITEDELSRAQDSVLNSFVFSFERPSQILSRVMNYEYYGYPEDFIFQYQQAIADTTTEDVLNAARTYLDPSKLVTLVVGNVAEIDPPLSDLGMEITPIDVTIPPRG